MTTINSNDTSFTTQLRSHIAYPETGMNRKTLIKTDQTFAMLMCLSAGTEIPEHTAPRNVMLSVIEGCGVLTLNGEAVDLEPGVFIYMPARTPHALCASKNLAILHT
jgi:quercetin dioxygenase-like cupin family protein